MAKSLEGSHILVFPYPAQGHMFPLLDLAQRLDACGLAVTIAITEKNRPILDPVLARSPKINTLVLPFPDEPSIPRGIENAKDLPFASFPAFLVALARLRGPLLQWARNHPSPPCAVISDMFLGWTTSMAAELGVPRLVFCPSGALAVSVANCLWRDMPKPADSTDPRSPIAFPSLPDSPVFPWGQISSIYRRYGKGDPFSEFIRDGFIQNVKSWGYVFNTCGALEQRYVEHMRAGLGHPRVWAVGPLCPPEAEYERGGPSSVQTTEVLTWLDQFELEEGEGSVVYACFGSQVKLSPPQAATLAAGLERSGVRFVWCVKESTEVPEGLEDRTAGRGMVIRGWAPQVAILGHPAVVWFLTHCGWNSTLEAVAAGVVLLTWPVTADQFINTRLMVSEIGVGVRVSEGLEVLPEPDELARVLAEAAGGGGGKRKERVMAAELRRRALEAVDEGGSSYNDLKELVDELSKLASVKGTDIQP